MIGRWMPRFVVSLVLLGALAATTGSASAARLYTPHYGGPPEVVGGFAAQSDGSIASLPGSPFPAYASPSPVSGISGFVFAPEGARAAGGFLFSGGVQGYSVDSAGAVAPAGSPITSASTTSIAISPDGRFVYAPTREFMAVPAEGIRIYSVGPAGTLAASGSAGSGRYGDVALTPNGRFLYATASNEIERFAVNADGSLTSLGSTSVGGPLTLQVSADGRFLFAAVEGAGDGVASFSIGADGSLTENGTPALTGDVAIGHFGVTPDGAHLYMPDSNLDAIVIVAIAANGVLTATGKLPYENPDSVAVSPDGRFLYVEARGSTPGIGAAAIGTDGSLKSLPFAVPWDPGEANRLVFQPQPAPEASFRIEAAAPGAATTFDAGGSVRAARFDWNFGDGAALADGGPTPVHVYARAGTYPVTLTVSDAQGCSGRQVYTGQSTACPGGTATTATATVDTLPAIEDLKLAKKKFRPSGPPAKKGAGKSRAPSVGTAFLYRLSEPAQVGFKIERRLPGRLVGASCKKPTKGNAKRRSCTRFQLLGSRSTRGKAGANTLKFAGRLKGRPLPPGPYRVTAVATDAAGGRSAPRSAAFKVIGG